MTIRTNNTNSDEPSVDEPRQKSQSTWGIVAGASLISTGLAAYEIVPASVTPVIRDSLHIGPTIAGFLVGIMFGTAVIASLPAGAILDRTDSRTAMLFAVLTLFVAGTWGWVAGHHGDYRSVIASRALGGVAYVVVWNAGIDIVSRAANSENRATAVGIFTASGPIGFALGQGTGPLIAERFGWPAIFLAFTGLTFVGLVVFWPASRGFGTSRGEAPSIQEFGAVLRNRSVWSIGLLGFLGYALYLFVNSWGSSYLTVELGFSLAISGLLVALFPAIGVVSRISSGLISDRVFGGRRQPIVLGSFGVAAPLVLVFTRFRSLPLLVALLLLTGFAVQLTLGLSFTYVREVVDPRVAATAVAFQTSIGLAGAFLAPIAGGVIVDVAGFDTAFVLAGILALCGIVVAWRAPEPARL
ncbi:MFS transporter [Halalkalicoccus jeotgali]|uniref:Sugar transporter n=1 Tax=Halalkalicoccus jeotgali (strain DSM 18796 / CECT 7217 / JCM 14584 / KCTC 4019 / B3) TaxID=795797 RepID=D8JCJ7_HALJB|nr:MFS transporter [Halalkalicoccus jeotgali]ADJ17104.1 sugar transporter [Halalkalicoccus jeotgali B3]ELY41741.1 sugar transporter [Halalkalicoccus jeotgali B3]